MREDDIAYYRMRRLQEMRAADDATDRCCRKAHLDLARRYGLRVVEGLAARAINAGMPCCILSIPVQ